jgi:uncharacterized protein
MNKLYCGRLWHKRYLPKSNEFSYKVFSLYIDVKNINIQLAPLRLMSVNRFNLFSYFEKDHFSKEINLPTADSHWDFLQKQLTLAHKQTADNISMLCYPRILGFVFNPLTTYYCFNAEKQLYAIIYQVHNTFNERHYYVCDWQENTAHSQAKEFYVSPFLPMQLDYSFTMSDPAEKIKQSILQYNQEKELVFAAAFNADAVELTDKNLLKLFFTIPLMTVTIFLRIHWQAIKLIAKGIRIVKKQQAYQKRKAEKL